MTLAHALVIGTPPENPTGNRHARRQAKSLAVIICWTLDKWYRKRRIEAGLGGYMPFSHPTKKRCNYRGAKRIVQLHDLRKRYENLIYWLGQRAGVWETDGLAADPKKPR